NARDKIGRVPLHSAANNGHLELVRLLLKHGGNVNACGHDSMTPLDEAKAKGYTEIVQLLSE
ncbi:ankyrin repeat-containing domain protein, partial [Lactarius hengduanensis]